MFVRWSAEHWIKVGVKFVDGTPQVGAVVTNGRSDWSAAPVPRWTGASIRVPDSWSGGAVTAGPFACAPTRAGLTVWFDQWRIVESDRALH